MQNYITKSEKNQLLCRAFWTKSCLLSYRRVIFTYFMTDIALFPAIIVSALLIIMKVWDGINDPIVGSFIDKHTFKNGEKMKPFLRYTRFLSAYFRSFSFLYFQRMKICFGCV